MPETPPDLSDDLLDRLDHYRQFLSADDLARLVESLEHPRRPAIRINTLKVDPAQVRQTWPDWYGWDVQPVPFCAAGWQITRQDQPLGQTLEYDMGQYYIQDAASMIPAELFSPAQAPLVLDLAAAPGGKTTHLVSRFEDRALVVANDTSDSRIAALRSNLQTWGAAGVLITHAPGERFGRWFPDTFDQVLLDAPCSGDTLRVNAGRKTRTVSDRERLALCQRQSALLISAFQAVRPDGEIVYSTCTMAPEEDEAVLDDLLRLYPRAAEIARVEHLPALESAPGLAADGDRVFQPGVRHAVRLWPHLYQTSGFFAARIRKNSAIPVDPDPPPARSWSASGWSAISRRDQETLIESLRQAYGFDLLAVMDDYALTLWQRADLVYAVPERLIARFADLPHAGAGLLIGQWADRLFVPSHELITRFYTEFSGSRFQIDESQVAAWRAGRDLRPVPDLLYPVGSVLLLEDQRGRFVGRGKLLRDRVRNLLPKRLTYG